MLSTLRRWTALAMLLGIVVALAACAPAATPTPTPITKAPTPAPAKAADPAKPPAPTPTAPPAPTPTPQPVTIKFGTPGVIADAGTYIAIDKGYFKEQGITMEVINFRSVAELIAPLGTGQLDIAALPLSVPLLAAADRGVELKIVAGGGEHRPNWAYGWIVLRKDLADSGQVKSPADLKGMKVAIPSLGSLGELTVQRMLEQAGLKPDDVEMVVLPFAEQAAAFGNKAIAASFTSEPFIARGIQEGFSVKWIPLYELFEGRLAGQLTVAGSGFLKDQDVARRWMTAYLKGARDYLKAFTTREGRDEVINILVKYSTIKDPKLYDLIEMPYLDPNGMPDKKSIETQYKWFVDKRLYTGKKTFDDIMDLSYVEYAAQRLGKQ